MNKDDDELKVAIDESRFADEEDDLVVEDELTPEDLEPVEINEARFDEDEDDLSPEKNLEPIGLNESRFNDDKLEPVTTQKQSTGLTVKPEVEALSIEGDNIESGYRSKLLERGRRISPDGIEKFREGGGFLSL